MLAKGLRLYVVANCVSELVKKFAEMTRPLPLRVKRDAPLRGTDAAEDTNL